MFINTNHPKQSKLHSLAMNLIAIAICSSLIIFLAWGGEQLDKPISEIEYAQISLKLNNLGAYGLHTLFRLVIGIILSIIFSIIYATCAIKSKRAEQILMPLLDVLQSVPILGYMSFTTASFVALSPNTTLGLEAVAIFAIFTSQAWNITFSIYQSFKQIPKDLLEVATIYNFNAWQKFWRIEIPYAIPGIIWNSIVSMSGAWFFIVAAETIMYKGLQIHLPGIGSYIAVALDQKDLSALFSAISTMAIIIYIFNQTIFKILLLWSSKFSSDAPMQNSNYWLYSSLSDSIIIQKIVNVFEFCSKKIVNIKITTFLPKTQNTIYQNKYLDFIWLGILLFIGVYSTWYILNFLNSSIDFYEVLYTIKLTMISLLRLLILLAVTSLIWVPLGIYIGLRPKLTNITQPLAQFLAAFPANIFFPLVVIYIVKNDLNPDIWLSPLMIVGAQWYILFNVISGTAQIPEEFKQVCEVFNIKGLSKYRKVIFPAIMPHYLTGLITAAGGGWNASIIAEAVSWGQTNLYAHGIGSYISQMTAAQNHPKIALGIIVMSCVVVILNKILWAKLQDYVTTKYSL